MKFKEKRTINAYDLRGFCIRHNLYTNGSCEEYDALLFKGKLAQKFAKQQNITTNDIYNIAMDIVKHSDQNDADFFLDIENTMFYIAKDICVTHFDII